MGFLSHWQFSGWATSYSAGHRFHLLTCHGLAKMQVGLWYSHPTKIDQYLSLFFGRDLWFYLFLGEPYVTISKGHGYIANDHRIWYSQVSEVASTSTDEENHVPSSTNQEKNFANWNVFPFAKINIPEGIHSLPSWSTATCCGLILGHL